MVLLDLERVAMGQDVGCAGCAKYHCGILRQTEERPIYGLVGNTFHKASWSKTLVLLKVDSLSLRFLVFLLLLHAILQLERWNIKTGILAVNGLATESLHGGVGHSGSEYYFGSS